MSTRLRRRLRRGRPAFARGASARQAFFDVWPLVEHASEPHFMRLPLPKLALAGISEPVDSTGISPNRFNLSVEILPTVSYKVSILQRVV